MNRKRKSRIWQLITICMVVFLAAFSLPIHVDAALEPHDAANPRYPDYNAEWSVPQMGLWDWMHNDFRDPMWSEFTRLETLIDNSNSMTSGMMSESGILNTINSKVSAIDLTKDLNDFYDEKTKGGKDEDMFGLVDTMNSKVGIANKLWGMVGKVMAKGGDLTVLDTEDATIKLGLDVENMTSKYNLLLGGFMKTLAYSLVLLFLSVGLIEQTIKYEIATLKGAVIFGGRIVLAKVIIDCSTTVCVKIVGITEWICENINKAGNAVPKLLEAEAKKPTSSSLWVIGKIIDFFNSITACTPILLITLVIIVVSIVILIKLLIRNVQLCILVVTAPAFFATLSSESTKRYFQNYITAFLQCSLQVVFMCIVWYIGIFLLNNHTISGDSLTKIDADASMYRALIIYICMGILICKPPKFLSNALN